MARYHIKGDGSPGVCNAEPGKCPFGENTPHFESEQAAQRFADIKNEIELEKDFHLSRYSIYELNEKEANVLVKSIDNLLDELNKEQEANDNHIDELKESDEWKNYKKAEENHKELRTRMIELSNSSEAEDESRKLMLEDLKRKTGVHEFKDGNHIIEISSENYHINKPKYKGFKVNEDGTRGQVILPKMPSEVVQKAFKSKENKEAFDEIKKADRLYGKYIGNSKDLIRDYPPVEFNTRLEEAESKEKEAAEELTEYENTKAVKEINNLEDENYKRWPKIRKLKESKEKILHVQEEIREFHNIKTTHKKGDIGQYSDDDNEILQRAREYGIEQPVRYIQHKNARALMADSLSDTRREQEELERRYDPILRRYGLSYWNGDLHLVGD